MNKQLIKELKDTLNLFEKEITIGSDGTHLKCTCKRENCHSLWLTGGDELYRVSYIHTQQLKETLKKLENLNE